MPTIHQRVFGWERFWTKVNKSGECWLWTAGLYHDGYGKFWDGKRHCRAHRFAYELLVAPIPDGLQLDHLCRVRHCVNPAHLEAVDCRTNLLRGTGLTATKAAQTHCVHGHPFDEVNTYIKPNGARGCRICRNRHAEASRRRRVA